MKIFGMPKVAIDMGGVNRIVPLDKIPQEIISYGK
jgi:chemotaxis response regulator CheB